MDGGDSGLVGGILLNNAPAVTFPACYVVTRGSFTNTLPSRDSDVDTSFSPHIILVPSLSPDSEGVRAHGAPEKGVSTYGIWPEPGSPVECRPLGTHGPAKRPDPDGGFDSDF